MQRLRSIARMAKPIEVIGPDHKVTCIIILHALLISNAAANMLCVYRRGDCSITRHLRFLIVRVEEKGSQSFRLSPQRNFRNSYAGRSSVAS